MHKGKEGIKYVGRRKGGWMHERGRREGSMKEA